MNAFRQRWRIALSSGLLLAVALAGVTGQASAAVTMTDVQAAWQGGKVVVQWWTATELNNVGFNILRSGDVEASYETWVTINSSLIISQCLGQVCGAAYSFDDTSASPGQMYWYAIQSLTNTGAFEINQPIACATGGPLPCEAPTETPSPTATRRPTDTDVPTATNTQASNTTGQGQTNTTVLNPATATNSPYDHDGDGNVTCADFTNQVEATRAFGDGYGNLDGDNDGVPCETVSPSAGTQSAATSTATHAPARTNTPQPSATQPPAAPASGGAAPVAANPTDRPETAAPDPTDTPTPTPTAAAAIAALPTRFTFATATLAATPTFAPIAGGPPIGQSAGDTAPAGLPLGELGGLMLGAGLLALIGVAAAVLVVRRYARR